MGEHLARVETSFHGVRRVHRLPERQSHIALIHNRRVNLREQLARLLQQGRQTIVIGKAAHVR